MRASKSRTAGALGLMAGLVVTAWTVGFVGFVREAVRPGAPPPAADGIVALTGGADRISSAFQLLQQGKGRLLLISGVGRATPLAAILRGSGIDPRPWVGRITLGREATDTWGNAEEAADWARAHELRSLIIVTAGYHMQRALTEIGRSLPTIPLYAAPVLPPALRRGQDFSTWRLLAGEYTKYLAARLGLTRLARAHEPG